VKILSALSLFEQIRLSAPSQIWLVFSLSRVIVHLNMPEQDAQLPLAKQAVRNRISSERWGQVKTAYASGIALREIARNMGISQGTVLAHAKRKGWTQQIEAANQDAKPMQSNTAITPFEALAITLNERKDESRLHLEQVRG